MEHILDLIELIEDKMRQPEAQVQLNNDLFFRFGMTYALLKITASTRRLSDEAKALMPEIVWQKISDFHEHIASFKSESESSFDPMPDMAPVK
jgi:uncharacterized protein with HEPN domain